MSISIQDRIQLVDDFLKRWPKEKLAALTLDEYTDVGNQDTFTYWLEHTTRPVGSIRGGDSSKFGIYKRGSEPKGERAHIQNGEVYSWQKRFGATEQEAFNTIKSKLLKVIDYVEKGDLNAIQAIDLSDTLKWKVAFLYQDFANPVVLNIFNRKMLQQATGNNKANFAQLYKQLMTARGDKHVVEYGYDTWTKLDVREEQVDELNKQEQREDAFLEQFLSVEHFNRYYKNWSQDLIEAFYNILNLANDRQLDVFCTDMNSNGAIRIGRKEKDEREAKRVFATFTPQKNGIKYKQRFLYDTDRLEAPVDLELIEKLETSKHLEQFFQEYPITRQPYWPIDYEINMNEKIKATSPTNIPLNQILYGPPGTGKTYHTVNRALEIIDPEFVEINKDDRAALKAKFDSLVSANRIGFVTFHQSFSYEDFVEGIKAETTENNQVNYPIRDGIFKEMCDAASSKETPDSTEVSIDIAGRNIWKMSLGNTLGDDAFMYQECINRGVIALGYGGPIDFSGTNSRREIANLYRENGYVIENESYDFNVSAVVRFKDEMNTGDLVVVTDGNLKFRAIAEITSDYYFEKSENGDYSQLRKVKWLKRYEPSKPVGELFNKAVSQQTIYRLRPPTIDLEKLQALLSAQTKHAKLKVGAEVQKYLVTSISQEVIELKKPNGSVLPIAMSLLNELVSLVKAKQISIADIKNKTVFEKVDSNLEKYLVNGYPNILAPLVETIIKQGISTEAQPTNTDKRVLIIDEINRGNIANIFGELITLIEPSKRAGGDETITVKLPYSKTPFSVPSNLYIIGTMNTADKSLAQVDIALRRRFEFIEMMPNYQVLTDIPEIEGINISDMLEAINQRIELLYDREHTIGHSFFLPLIDEPTIDKLANIFELQILPLLEEYFFEDWQRAGQVLGDHLKQSNDHKFFIEKFDSNRISKLMGNNWEQAGIQPFTRNAKALFEPQAYIGIYDTTR